MDIKWSETGDRGRYEAYGENGARAGEMTYRREEGKIFIDHTGTEDAFKGQGIASALVRAAIADAKAGDYRIVPVCSFVEAYFKKHPEDAAAVATKE